MSVEAVCGGESPAFLRWLQASECRSSQRALCHKIKETALSVPLGILDHHPAAGLQTSMQAQKHRSWHLGCSVALQLRCRRRAAMWCQSLEHQTLCATLQMVTDVQDVAKSVSDEELRRAKQSAINGVLMNLESRAVVSEDIGRQVLAYGKR